MDIATALAKLREPFPKTQIRHLPRVWCKSCRDSRAGCNYHQLTKCAKCGNKISTAHIDLAYVGHAEATNRLLNVDPAWTWEPLATDTQGLPQFDQNGGLWIKLTILGVTRLGYGNAEGKRGGDAIKEIIGDAIRNAAMRFGMALDLWTSSDLEVTVQDNTEQCTNDPHGATAPEEGLLSKAEQAETADWVYKAEQAETADQCVEIYKQANEARVSTATLAAVRSVGELLREAEKAAVSQVVEETIPADWPETATPGSGGLL